MRPALALAALALVAACKRAPRPAAEEPQQNLEGLRLSQSDKGRPSWDLRAKSAQLTDGDRVAALVSPNLAFYKKGAKVSTVTSATGSIRTDTYDVTLSSRVLVRALDDGSTLATEELRYDSKRKLFVTDKDVFVTRPSGRLRGTGLEATPDLTDIRIFNQRTVLDEAPR